MLQFRNGRFHAYGVSFQFPDGFYLDTAPDLENECGIVAWGPQEDYRVEWDFVEEEEGPEAVLQRFFSPGYGMEPLSEVEPYALGGLVGYRATYHSGKQEYFEARFSLEDNVQFVLLIHAEGQRIRDVLAFSAVQAILKDIRVD